MYEGLFNSKHCPKLAVFPIINTVHGACLSNVRGACIISFFTNEGPHTVGKCCIPYVFRLFSEWFTTITFTLARSTYESNIVLAINSAFFPFHAKEYVWEVKRSLIPLLLIHSSFLSLCLPLKASSLYFFTEDSLWTYQWWLSQTIWKFCPS